MAAAIARLGHRSIRTTLDICYHFYEVATDRLEQLIADAIAHRARSIHRREL